jgi:hypothetical protein
MSVDGGKGVIPGMVPKTARGLRSQKCCPTQRKSVERIPQIARRLSSPLIAPPLRIDETTLGSTMSPEF